MFKTLSIGTCFAKSFTYPQVRETEHNVMPRKTADTWYGKACNHVTVQFIRSTDLISIPKEIQMKRFFLDFIGMFTLGSSFSGTAPREGSPLKKMAPESQDRWNEQCSNTMHKSNLTFNMHRFLLIRKWNASLALDPRQRRRSVIDYLHKMLKNDDLMIV